MHGLPCGSWWWQRPGSDVLGLDACLAAPDVLKECGWLIGKRGNKIHKLRELALVATRDGDEEPSTASPKPPTHLPSPKSSGPSLACPNTRSTLGPSGAPVAVFHLSWCW